MAELPVCRLMFTRRCPPSGCDGLPCARFEDDDVSRWPVAHPFTAVDLSGGAGRQLSHWCGVAVGPGRLCGRMRPDPVHSASELGRQALAARAAQRPRPPAAAVAGVPGPGPTVVGAGGALQREALRALRRIEAELARLRAAGARPGSLVALVRARARVSAVLPADAQALVERERTGCLYEVGSCWCPGAPYAYRLCQAP